MRDVCCPVIQISMQPVLHLFNRSFTKNPHTSNVFLIRKGQQCRIYIERAADASQKSTKVDRQVNTQTCGDSRQEEEPEKTEKQREKKSRQEDRQTH